MTSVRAPRSRRLGLLLFAAVALLAAACSSDGDDASGKDGGGSGRSKAESEQVLGEKKPASGEPVRIGYVYDGTTDVLDNADELAAAEAATRYVNDYLGGVAGRPVELDVCSTEQTPSGAADCVTQLVSDGVPVVLNGVTGQAANVYGPLAEAGVPVFAAAAQDPRGDGITIMTNGIVSLVAGPAQIAADADVERAAIVVIDVPAASGALESAAPLFYGNAGVEVDIVTVSPDTPDMTPNIQAALSKDPGMFAVVGDPVFCGKAMSALATVGFDGMTVIIPQCIDETFKETATNLEGAIVLSSTTTDPDSEEFQLYEAVMAVYAEGDVDLGGVAPSGYQAVVGFGRAMAALTGEVTPETVQAALEAMEPTPMPLADGLTFVCDRKQVAIAEGLCATDVLQTTLDAEGNPTEYEILKGADVLKL